MSIRPQIGIGARVHRVTLTEDGPAMPTPDGGYTHAPVALVPPDWICEIAPASAADLEGATAGTSVTRATHILTGPYHPRITTATRIAFGSRVFFVSGVTNRYERDSETVAYCEEQVRG